MKWRTIMYGIVSLAACGVSLAETVTCQTSYASTSTTKVPTRTSTRTITIQVLYTTNVGVTSTITYTTSYVSVVGKTTVTVPTGAAYTPLTDAPIFVVTSANPGDEGSAETSPESAQPVATYTVKKAFASSKKSTAPSLSKKASTLSIQASQATSYPNSVSCTSTLTLYHSSTRTGYVYVNTTTWLDKTSTTQVPTSTAYAACEDPENVLREYNGKLIEASGPSGSSGTFESLCSGTSGGTTSPQGAIACLNARTCCEGAQQGKFDGWIWGDLSGVHSCLWINGSWEFTTSYPLLSNNQTWGNGPAGPGGTYEDVIFS